MEKYLLTNWRPTDLRGAPPAVLRLAGHYLQAATGFCLLLHPDCTFILCCFRDLGGRWARLLAGRYQPAGPVVHLLLSATQRAGYGRYATLRLHHGPDGQGQWVVPLAEATAAPYHRLLRQAAPQLLRCISGAFGSKSFAASLTVGQCYASLGPATKPGFVLVINDNSRVRQYPAEAFRPLD